MEDAPLPRSPRGMRPLIGLLDLYGQMPLVGPLLTVGRAYGPGLLDVGLSIAPGSGEVMSARDSVEAGRRMSEAIRAGDYGGALSAGAESMTAALGALPFVGMAIRGARGARRVPYALPRHDPSLPMDAESRLQRARELGFDPDRPVDDPRIWYHATNRDFPAFDRRFIERQGDHFYPGRQGFWFARAPETAEAFAPRGAGVNTIPVRLRLGRPGQVDWNPNWQRHELSTTLADMRSQGYDSLIIRGYGPGDVGWAGRAVPRSDVAVIFEPHNIRSVHAAFDPRLRDSANLLAGIGGAAALPLLNLGLGGSDEPQR